MLIQANHSETVALDIQCPGATNAEIVDLAERWLECFGCDFNSSNKEFFTQYLTDNEYPSELIKKSKRIIFASTTQVGRDFSASEA